MNPAVFFIHFFKKVFTFISESCILILSDMTKEICMKNKKEMLKARIEDLVKQGVDRELAKIMAKAEFESGLYLSGTGTIVY